MVGGNAARPTSRDLLKGDPQLPRREVLALAMASRSRLISVTAGGFLEAVGLGSVLVCVELPFHGLLRVLMLISLLLG